MSLLPEIHEFIVPDAPGEIPHFDMPAELRARMVEPGIYFGMDEDAYHAIPACSTSLIKQIIISPMDAWAVTPWLNPDARDEDSEAKLLGRAYHKRILEGKRAFWDRFAVALDPKDYPNALRTADDLKEALKALGEKISGSKPDLIERLLAADPTAEIWDRLVKEHAARNDGRQFITADQMKRIEIAAAMIENHPQLCKAFTGGYAEVTIIWTHPATGVPMKARLDYLKSSAICDLKTFSNQRAMPIDRALYMAMTNNRYYIQAAVYHAAVDAALEHIKAGRVHGDVDRDWLKRLCKPDDRQFLFVFQQTGAAPVARGKLFPRAGVMDIGRIQARTAIDEFARCISTFGTDPWIDTTEISVFDDEGFPAYLGVD